MSLSDYKGPANSTEILQHLVGERIYAAFADQRGKIILVLESGHGIDFFSLGGDSPGFGPLRPEEIGRLIAARRKDINQKLAELREMPGVELP